MMEAQTYAAMDEPEEVESPDFRGISSDRNIDIYVIATFTINNLMTTAVLTSIRKGIGQVSTCRCHFNFASTSKIITAAH